MRRMDREAWRRERRLWNEVQMDTIYARQYDERWGASINDAHRQMLGRFLDCCPPHARILALSHIPARVPAAMRDRAAVA